MMQQERKPITETHPEMAEEWDYEKNDALTPDKVHAGFTKPVHWKCKNGHLFERSPYRRTSGKKAPDYIHCKYCNHLLPVPGEYSLATECPEILEEWDWEENEKEGLDPDNIMPHANRNAHWVCSKGHKWVSKINQRVGKDGSIKHRCATCAKESMHKSKKMIPGTNDLASAYPEIAAEWDYERNDKSPDEVHSGSGKEYWWKCSKCGHRWTTRVNHRTKDNTGCPVCNGIAAGEDYNLEVCYPKIAAEWCYEENDKLFDGKSPKDFAPNSAVKPVWQCPNNPTHRYRTRIGHRIEGYNCPFCSHRQIKREDSLGALFPELLEEWDWERNERLDPFQLAPGAANIVFWICRECGHKWKAAISDRTRRQGGCFECKKHIGTSFAEQLVYLGCKRLFPQCSIKNRYRPDYTTEIDVYIDELSIGIERSTFCYSFDVLGDSQLME